MTVFSSSPPAYLLVCGLLVGCAFAEQMQFGAELNPPPFEMFLLEADVETCLDGRPHHVFLKQFATLNGEPVTVSLFGLDQRRRDRLLAGIVCKMEAVAIVLNYG